MFCEKLKKIVNILIYYRRVLYCMYIHREDNALLYIIVIFILPHLPHKETRELFTILSSSRRSPGRWGVCDLINIYTQKADRTKNRYQHTCVVSSE